MFDLPNPLTCSLSTLKFLCSFCRSSNNGMRFDFEINLPRLQGQGNYDINGQILTLPLRGNGPFTGNFSKL